MSGADATKTLGRSGQVVRRYRGGVGGAATDHRSFSGSKRPLKDSFSCKVDASLSFTNKRFRGDDNSRGYRQNYLSGERIDEEDLRVKLTRKRMLQSQPIEIRGKPSRARSSGQSQRSSRRSLPLTRTKSAGELRQMDSIRSSSSRAPVVGLKWPHREVKASVGISAAVRNSNEMRKVPSVRRSDASGTQNLVNGGVNRLQSRVPVGRKPATELPTDGSLLKSSRPGTSPQTVTSLLHSLDLGEYAINFQAEEVDMTALKQMGDRDLKELGLPMGPRKKILLAMLPPSKRSTS